MSRTRCGLVGLPVNRSAVRENVMYIVLAVKGVPEPVVNKQSCRGCSSALQVLMKASSSGYMKGAITMGGRSPYSLPVL